MMMTMRVSDVLLPPRPSYLASSGGLSRLSPASGAALPPFAESEVVDHPMVTDDEEYQALMLAEFGPLMPLLTQDEVQSMVLAAAADDEETQASLSLLLPEDEAVMTIGCKNEMEACPEAPDKKKRKKPTPQPSTEDDAIDEPPSPRPSSKRAKEAELPSPRATNKTIATCLLKRRHSAPEPSEPEGRTVLWCQCKELPRDSPGCALHQAAPFRSWMLDQDQIPAVGSDDGVVVPRTRTERRRTVLKYIRWRGRVWMPSRFYVEHAQAEMAQRGVDVTS